MSLIVRRVIVDVALVTLSALEMWGSYPEDLPWPLQAGVALGLIAIPLRHALPLVACALVIVSVAIMPTLVAPAVVLFTLALQRRRLTTAVIAAVLIATAWILSPGMTAIGIATQADGDLRSWLLTIGSGVALAGFSVAAGRLVRAEQVISAQLRALRAAETEGAALAADAALAHERTLLAREMHDVVSHQVSLIAVEAGALQLTTSDADARASASTIRALAAGTLTELRHLVGVLRATGGGTAIAPQPTLTDLPTLIAASSIAVNVSEGMPDGIGAAVARTAYRVVQEALTNVRKHAPGAHTQVSLTAAGRGLTVVVENEAPATPALDLPGGGVGLLGLAERAAILGGTLDAGVTSSGGFRVTMRVPDRSL